MKNKLNSSWVYGAVVVVLFSSISILLFPWLFTSLNTGFFFKDKSEDIASIINGIASPFIAVGAAVLTYLAFWIQYKANENQREDIKNQRDDISTERFESMFFEMIRFHRDNVNIINGRDKTDRNDLFITMFFELRFIYNFAFNLVADIKNKDKSFEISKKEIYKIAYMVFFSGSNPDTKDKLARFFKSKPFQKTLFEKLVDELRGIKKSYIVLKENLVYLSKIVGELDEDEQYVLKNGLFGRISFKELKNENQEFWYAKSNGNLSLVTKSVTRNDSGEKFDVIFWLLREPFGGHTNELGHYFRHLFQTIEYLNEYDKSRNKDNDIIDGETINVRIYKYFKMLRAQLSDYEMLLLYYHSLSTFGDEWLNEKKDEFLIKYKVLKKMPFTYADFYENPEGIIKSKDGRPMFDWYKHEKLMSE